MHVHAAQASGEAARVETPPPCRPLGADDFPATLEEVGRLLANARLSVALYSLTAGGEATEDLASLIERAFEPVAFVGRLDEASVGLLYVGPHAATSKGRRRLHCLITGTLRFALGHAWPGNMAAAVEIRAVHCTSDALMRPEALLEILARARSQRVPYRSGSLVTN